MSDDFPHRRRPIHRPDSLYSSGNLIDDAPPGESWRIKAGHPCCICGGLSTAEIWNKVNAGMWKSYPHCAEQECRAVIQLKLMG